MLQRQRPRESCIRTLSKCRLETEREKARPPTSRSLPIRSTVDRLGRLEHLTTMALGRLPNRRDDALRGTATRPARRVASGTAMRQRARRVTIEKRKLRRPTRGDLQRAARARGRGLPWGHTLEHTAARRAAHDMPIDDSPRYTAPSGVSSPQSVHRPLFFRGLK